MSTNRITYIDSIRSIAIIMVLEGHFITQSLQIQYRDDSNIVYDVWKFSRSLTAPIFLFISGLIFTYLLLKNQASGFNNSRMIKGVKRATKLILIGYALQLNLYTYFVLDRPLFSDLFKIFHILQCIGSCILIIVFLYVMKTLLKKISLGIYTLLLGLFFFCLCPTIEFLNYDNVPQFIENILTVSKNPNYKPSVFPLFPWAGYVMFGATLGSIFHKYPKLAHSYLLPISLFSCGFILNKYYYQILGLFFDAVNSNSIVDFSEVYHLARLGQVFMVLGGYLILYFNKSIFAKFFRFVPWDNSLFVKIGQNTLSIFTLHVIILYQGFFGWKINELTSKKLSPWQSIIGAVVFIAFFVLWVKYLEDIKQIPTTMIKKLKSMIFSRKTISFALKKMK
ncbi:heparan-alpha-glucosaminide N-acetyltransferase domain-containing protein [Wenyingzhuangia sp. IMCC45533]